MNESYAADAVQAIVDADEDSERAQLAYILGDFPKYFEGRVAAARSRMDQRYRELNERASKREADNSGASGRPTD